ncbi:hypothetical protein HDU78_009521 [Chytriomyces hyalinus]|nr:hypothetical protein HDU78_009521 [Chytriomyces hyalinus]
MDFMYRSVNNLAGPLLTPLDQPFIHTLLQTFLVLYAGLVAPQLPTSVLHVFDYTVVKIATFALVIYFSDHNVGSAILVASALVISILILTSRGGKYIEHLDTVHNDHPEAQQSTIY